MQPGFTISINDGTGVSEHFPIIAVVNFPFYQDYRAHAARYEDADMWDTVAIFTNIKPKPCN